MGKKKKKKTTIDVEAKVTTKKKKKKKKKSSGNQLATAPKNKLSLPAFNKQLPAAPKVKKQAAGANLQGSGFIGLYHHMATETVKSAMAAVSGDTPLTLGMAFLLFHPKGDRRLADNTIMYPIAARTWWTNQTPKGKVLSTALEKKNLPEEEDETDDFKQKMKGVAVVLIDDPKDGLMIAGFRLSNGMRFGISGLLKAVTQAESDTSKSLKPIPQFLRFGVHASFPVSEYQGYSWTGFNAQVFKYNLDNAERHAEQLEAIPENEWNAAIERYNKECEDLDSLLVEEEPDEEDELEEEFEEEE